MSSIPRTTYIYALIDPRDGRLRYVGKANDPDLRLRNHVKESRKGGDDHKCRWLACVLREGIYPRLRILEECQEVDWKDRERYWIWLLRGYGCALVNAKDGGDGLDVDDVTREKMSAAKRGKAPHNKGKRTSDDARKKQSEAARRRWARMSDDERRMHTQPAQQNRKPISEGTREKLREVGRRRTYTIEQNARNAARQQSLNSEQVMEVRRLLSVGLTYKKIGRHVGCSEGIVGNIKRGQGYKIYDPEKQQV